MASVILTVSWIAVSIALAALFYRLVTFLLTAFFGKNINVSYVNAAGEKTSVRINVDDDDELLDVLSRIKAGKGSADARG